MAQRERAEALGERDLPGVVEALVAQEDHLVVEQRLAHLSDLIVAEGAAGVDAADLRTDVAGEPGHGNTGLAGDGVGHGGAFRVRGRMRAGSWADAGRAGRGHADKTADSRAGWVRWGWGRPDQRRRPDG